MTTESKRIARWISTAIHTYTHSEYVLLTAFPFQQWLHGRGCMLHFTYIACLISVFRVGYTADDAETMKTLRNGSVVTHN